MQDRTEQDILKRLPGRRVLVVGDVMLDEYLWGEASRLSQEAPVPVVALRQRTWVPGGAANTAANVAGLGGEVLLAGIVGNDEAGARLRQALVERGMSDEGLLVDESRPTTSKTRLMAQGQQVARFDCWSDTQRRRQAADGVIVGSAVVRQVQAGGTLPEKCARVTQLCRSLAERKDQGKRANEKAPLPWVALHRLVVAVARPVGRHVPYTHQPPGRDGGQRTSPFGGRSTRSRSSPSGTRVRWYSRCHCSGIRCRPR